MMKKMEAAGSPGPAHKALDALAGDWKVEMKCGTEPGGSPQVTQGTAKAQWTFNGRFLEEEFHGQMMGKPFTGRTVWGFDNTKQTFNSVWISDTATSMFTSEGKGDSGNKVITMEGKTSCAVTGRTDLTMKTVLRVSSRDKHVLEMRTQWVCAATGGPFKYTPTKPGSTELGLEEAHRDLRISPGEFDEVAAELGRTLDFVKVPEREKMEVLAAFAAHKNEVTAGYKAK